MGVKKGNCSLDNVWSEPAGMDAAVTTYTKGSDSCGPAGKFREGVMSLLRMRNQAAAAPLANELVNALLAAEEEDAEIEGALLGMAAAQCARLQQHVLLGPLCMFSSLRLASYGGREVAELATAAWKLGRPDPGFLRAMAKYCESPPVGAFKSMRDIAMLALVCYQSFKGGMPSVDHAAALKGLVELALLHLQGGSPRDVVEFLHALTHSLEARSLRGNVPLYQEPVVVPLLEMAFEFISKNMHLASAFDVAMAAGSAAAAWQLIDCLHDSILRPCLIDSATAARFRRIDFSLRDLALLASAFAKTGVSSKELACVFNEVVVPSLADVPVRDLCCFLWAAANVSGWKAEPFATATASEVARRKPTTFGPQDLCSLAQSLSKLCCCGSKSSEKVWGATFRRQLFGFSAKDKAICLSVLAERDATEHPALCKMLVRSLAAGDHRVLETEQVGATLTALAKVWSLLADDPLLLLLFNELIEAQPWHRVGLAALMQLMLAFAKIPVESASGNLWEPVVVGVATELAARLRNGETLLEADAQQLVENLSGATPMLPHRLAAEMLNLLSADEDGEMADSSVQPPQFRRAQHDSPRATLAVCSDNTATDLTTLLSQEHPACRPCEPLTAPSVEEAEVLVADTFTATTIMALVAVAMAIAMAMSMGIAMSVNDEAEEEPHSEPVDDLSIGNWVCKGAQHGEASGRGHAHGHLQEGSTEVAQHEQPYSSCADSTCCRSFGSNQRGAEVRLNAHCDFRGHCVQLKHTFLHIPCTDSDSDSDGGSCVVCRLARSSSV
eukprot:CAMPEP_0172833512 /NCGR_PEP_ID=MMETSP1075-20121228/24409_1 /TAXON_ID=2916 /ORGANISM="Ceratium fusus, Strain PA161109" /LENGTH=785 /DNA_ID=CAMNT_0013676263 /DNA_START=54 /DNA_END=2411 /DNA_ORIENTATION=-